MSIHLSKPNITHKQITIAAIVVLSVAVLGLSGAAVWKHHQDSVVTVDKLSQAVVQRNSAVQALANQEAVNKVLTQNNTDLTSQVSATKAKLVALCTFAVNRNQAACK